MASEQELKRKLEIAMAASLQNKWPEAEKLYEDVVKDLPNVEATNPAMEGVARAYYSLALALNGNQAKDRIRLSKALSEAKEAIRAFQQTNEPPQSVALAYRAIGMSILFMISQEVIWDDQWPTLYPEGISALKKAIELDPQDQQARKYLGLLQSAQNVAKLHGAKTGGCFIATASYGSMVAPEVVAFRQFRDKVLLRSNLGRTFVAFYYLTSPPLALLLSKHEHLRVLTRRFVLEPLLGVITKGRK
jgi:hypothetical protein